MRRAAKFATAAVLWVLPACAAFSQEQSHRTSATLHAVAQEDNSDRRRYRPLTEDDRLSVIAAALDVKAEGAESDCSHLVHAVYQEAGFPYSYAPSSELYAGVGGFQRVKKPATGDLVVWRGHVGIVTKPSQHKFFSVLSTGPGIDDYTAPYWKRRGKPRFYRYMKSAAEYRSPTPQLLRTDRGRHAVADEDPE